MIIYFTGTGNSRYAAEYINKTIFDEIVDATKLIKEEKIEKFESKTPYIFICPTYAWRIPRVFEDFIRRSTFLGNKKAYFLMTCGGAIYGAEKYIEKLCEEKDFEYMGVAEVVMPENYTAMFYVPNKDEAKAILENSKKYLERDALTIQKESRFYTNPIKPFYSDIINPLFYTFCVSAKKFYSTEKCISCQKCISLCPMNNISFEDEHPVWGNECTHCMACICGCPTSAIEYGNKSKKRNRYFNTEKV